MKTKSPKTNSKMVKSNKPNKINFDRSSDSEIETSCRSCTEWKEDKQKLNNKIKDLEDIINSYDLLQLVDTLKDLDFYIPKEKQLEIDEAFSVCDESIKIRFHGNYLVSSIHPDNPRKNNQDQDTSFPNSPSIENVRPNDSDT